MFLCGYNGVSSIPFDTTKAVKPKDPFCIRDISWMFIVPDKRKKSSDFNKLKIYCVVLNSLDSSQPYTLVKTGGNTCDVKLIGQDWHISYNVNDYYATYSTQIHLRYGTVMVFGLSQMVQIIIIQIIVKILDLSVKL